MLIVYAIYKKHNQKYPLIPHPPDASNSTQEEGECLIWECGCKRWIEEVAAQIPVAGIWRLETLNNCQYI